jgi:pimeloyl-ACP methyl ester carboxylesterase
MENGQAAEKRSVAASDGVEIEYEVLGKGPPMLLVHGGFAGRFTFSRQRSFAERYRLIIPSSRGHDGTDGTLPPSFGFATSEVDDLLAVLQAEGVNRAHMMGHSTGGATAFAFARRLPERVDRLVLIEPTLLPILPPAEREVVAELFLSIIDLGRREGGVAALCAIIDWSGGEAWHNLDDQTKASRLQALAPLAHLVAPHGQGLLALPISEADVRALEAPTLLVYGTSSFDPHPAIRDRWRELRPDLQMIVAEGAGHNVHRDKSDVVNSAVLSFVSK